MTEDAKQYQMTCLFPPSLNQEQLDKAIQKIKQLIITQGGSFSQEKNPTVQLKRIAYPINKHQEAFYAILNFSLPTQMMEVLAQQLNLENILIRYLITGQAQPKAKIDKEIKETIDYNKMVEKVESMSVQKKSTPINPELSLKNEKPVSEIKEKAEIEELDKKLEEILNT
jgi:small subunit ribosomal protein S6